MFFQIDLDRSTLFEGLVFVDIWFHNKVSAARIDLQQLNLDDVEGEVWPKEVELRL